MCDINLIFSTSGFILKGVVMIILELLEKGGFVMAVILLLSVYVVAVIIYKSLQFIKYALINRAHLNLIIKNINNKDYRKAYELAIEVKDNPMAIVAIAALKVGTDNTISDEKKMQVLQAIGQRELGTFETHLRGLEMAAAVAPLLGLLGTVLGMISSFSGIGSSGSNVDPAVLADGIWQALLATVAGLGVAIPALAAYCIIDAKIEGIRSVMNNIINKVLYKNY